MAWAKTGLHSRLEEAPHSFDGLPQRTGGEGGGGEGGVLYGGRSDSDASVAPVTGQPQAARVVGAQQQRGLASGRWVVVDTSLRAWSQ